MTQANDSHVSGGTTFATHLIAGKELPLGLEADFEGHIKGSAPAYWLFSGPRVTGTGAADIFDLFNATGSGKLVRVRGLWAILLATGAQAFAASINFDLMRTSAVGTGGTAHTYGGNAAPAAGGVVLQPLDTNNPALPAQITARGLPTGGATADDYQFPIPLLSEETNPATALIQGINFIPELPHEQALEINENQGIKIRQVTTVASTGLSIGWLMAVAIP